MTSHDKYYRPLKTNINATVGKFLTGLAHTGIRQLPTVTRVQSSKQTPFFNPKTNITPKSSPRARSRAHEHIKKWEYTPNEYRSVADNTTLSSITANFLNQFNS